ncbi:DNA-directed RNA polymerase II subunit RPB1-like [Notolabrus celidotus]|uniref:DNA-directed RNA polymerase II subunit RPB1-like n=1 Tax=Notolabrus celidotus TaxID=1203425 RepID=UPI00148F9ADF|nr:DNA-directed RNA polymerase II subunit RPB1-like [Notolabrus celidotus]
MASSQVFTSVSLFALLIVEICCLPVKTGYDPSTSGGSYSSAVPTFGSGHGASSYAPGASSYAPGASSYAPGASSYAPGASSYAPSGGASGLSYQPEEETGFAQPAVRGLSASLVGHSGAGQQAAVPNPANFAMTGPGFQQGPQDVNWAVQPLSFITGDEGYGVPEALSAPQGPVYQGGDLSGYEGSYEHGASQRETGAQGYIAPSPLVEEAASVEYTSELQPNSDMVGTWGVHPYYDYMFMTGQYPPGTITHSSSSYEQGRDNFQDVHYQRYYIPQYTLQEISVRVPQPQQPIAAPVKGKGKY